MSPVQLILHDGALFLRARNSELVILTEHVSELQKIDKVDDFHTYFLSEALLNRPARKLFQAWLRKDLTLWDRIFTEVKSSSKKEKPEG